MVCFEQGAGLGTTTGAICEIERERTGTGRFRFQRRTTMSDEDKLGFANPWHPMTDQVAKKHLLKLIEELNECSAAAARCLMQGIDECEPVTGKPNRKWLEDEMADVDANLWLVEQHFKLDISRMLNRTQRKIERLQGWHSQA
jgi:hypothetical protein